MNATKSHRCAAADDMVAAGKMTAIGLEPIKARLGVKWERLSGLVCALFEAAIKRSLDPGDAFFRTGELTFIVVYRNVMVAEAQLRCVELARHVCARLFGENGSEISIRNLVGPIDSRLITANQNPERAISEALERTGTETIISADQIKATLADAAAHPRFELRFTQKPQTYFSASLEELSFAYRPIWDCAFDMIITYLCQPVPRGDVVPSPSAGFCTLEGTDEDRASLDCIVLSHCLERIEKSRQARSRVLLAVPLHFSTLGRPRAWAAYGEIFRAIPRDVLLHLVFVIFALEGAPNSRLVQELPKLAGARHVFCALDYDDPAGERFRDTSVHAIGMEIPEFEPHDAKMAGSIKSMALAVRTRNFEPFVFGVQSTSSVLSAMAAGVRYLEGSAIHPMTADPRSAVAHGLKDIYGDRLRSGLINIKRI
jgi:hypothetical protein